MLDIALLRRDLNAVITRLERRSKPQSFVDVTRFSALVSPANPAAPFPTQSV